MLAALDRVDGKAEIVGGEIVVMSPAGWRHNRFAGNVYLSLRAYERATGRGFALTDNAAFLVDLPHRKSFSPDAAFCSEPPVDQKFLSRAPIFAVEVRSEEDYGPAAERQMAAKRADYFAAGTQVVWDVDGLRDGLIRSFRADAPNRPSVFRRGEVADAEPALPGWTFPVDDLFQ